MADKTQMRFLGFGVLVCLAACATNLHRTPTSSEGAFVLEGFAPLQNPMAIESGVFVIPNERNFMAYEPKLRGQKGTLVSVGTLRALLGFGLGDFDHLVMADHDSQTLRFNQANLELILECPTKECYLQELLSKSRLDELLVPSDVLKGSDIYDQFIRAKRFRLKSIFHQWAENPTVWSKTYFGNDELYARARKAIQEGRIKVASIDFTDRVGMRRLAARLNAMGWGERVADVSNFGETLLRSTKMPPEHSHVHALSELLGADGLVLMTFSADGSSVLERQELLLREARLWVPDSSWLYMSMTVRDIGVRGQLIYDDIRASEPMHGGRTCGPFVDKLLAVF